MAGVVYQKRRRLAWKQSRHSYLIDVGNRIGIRQVQELADGEMQVLSPPYPETRYFEVEIDETRSSGTRTYVFQNIYPVHARRKPDWHLLKFRIRHGGWAIDRISQGPAGNGPQWIYNDDFNLLFVSSGGRHDHEGLVGLINEKLDLIASSECAGTPVLSQFESERACRDAFGTIFSDGVDGAFRDTLLYQQHGDAMAGTPADAVPVTGAGVTARHGRAAPVEQAASLNVDITKIDELNDLSWLME